MGDSVARRFRLIPKPKLSYAAELHREKGKGTWQRHGQEWAGEQRTERAGEQRTERADEQRTVNAQERAGEQRTVQERKTQER